MITVTIPMKLESVANGSQGITRGGRIARARKQRAQKEIVALVLRPALNGHRLRMPLVVVMTRIAPRALDDDNLAYSMKRCRDQIAELLGIDDRDPRVRWVPTQERGAPKQYAFRITITEDQSAAKGAA